MALTPGGRHGGAAVWRAQFGRCILQVVGSAVSLRVDLGVGLEAEPGLLDVELHLVGERRDEHRLQQLVVVGAHLDVADGRRRSSGLRAPCATLTGSLDLALVAAAANRSNAVFEAIVAELVVLAGEALLERRRVGIELRQRVVVIFAHLLDDADAVLADGARRAQRAAVVGVPVHLEPGVLAGLDQQQHVVAPVAGDHRVRARGLDLGDVRREVLHLLQRVQLVADDLDVGALLGEHLRAPRRRPPCRTSSPG